MSLPLVRPPANSRRFVSKAVEAEIARVSALVPSDIATLFANCFPNTLDTTIEWPNRSVPAFVVTGDIDAMWLRDSTNQVLPYVSLASRDAALRALLASVIARQAMCVNVDPHANAFYADATSQVSQWTRDATSALSFASTHTPAMRNVLHERKFEIDSLGSFFQLATRYWQATGDATPFDAAFRSAVAAALQTLALHARLDSEATSGAAQAPYLFQRQTAQPSDSLQDGVGSPVRRCGLIWTAFRPSDDAAVLHFNIPQNAFVAVELGHLAQMATALGWTDVASAAQSLADSVTAAISAVGVVKHPALQKRVFAYEVDGFGNAIFMDDGNSPSLLSLPYLGFVPANDSVYLDTRAMLLSNATNPYFFRGAVAEGIGSPHTGHGMIWPMSLVTRALTTDDEAEIRRALQQLVASSAGSGLMHESFDRNNAARFTRPWFAWANTYFAHAIQQLLLTHPNVFK